MERPCAGSASVPRASLAAICEFVGWALMYFPERIVREKRKMFRRVSFSDAVEVRTMEILPPAPRPTASRSLLAASGRWQPALTAPRFTLAPTAAARAKSAEVAGVAGADAEDTDTSDEDIVPGLLCYAHIRRSSRRSPV